MNAATPQLEVKCSHCGEQIVKSYASEVKLRATLLKWTPAGFFAVCKGCKRDVPMSFDLLKSIETSFRFEVDASQRPAAPRVVRRRGPVATSKL